MLACCTGTKCQCKSFKCKLFHSLIPSLPPPTINNVNNNDKNDQIPIDNIIEILINYNKVLLPFMNSLANGSQNTNLYFNVKVRNETTKNSNSTLRFLPLDASPIKNQIKTKHLSFKVLLCGTFKRNLQPMVCSL